MKNLILSLMLAVGISFATEAGELQAMAKVASTPAEHSKVAVAYQDWASLWDAKADKYERHAEALANNYDPMRQKWPALANAPVERSRQLAMQARRAANEARALALKHQEIAATKLAADD